MNHRYQIGIKYFWMAAGTSLLALPLLLYGQSHFRRPARVNQERTLFQGIAYKRDIRISPRPLVIHIVAIDLTAPGVKVQVTPGTPTVGPEEIPTEINALTTSEFLKKFKLQLAINASFFYPFREVTPWDYYPHSGNRANVVGEAIANGSSYSQVDQSFPALCFNANNRAQIVAKAECPKGTIQGIAGNQLLIADGKAVNLNLSKISDQSKPYPRVAAAIDKQGKKLWLILVDGKQPLYSEGATTAELTKIILELGADQALNLDGGGSTTLVAATDKEPNLLNAAIHTKLPMRERPVANHLGFSALPK